MHKFVDLCMYTRVCSVSTLHHWSLYTSSHLFVNFLDSVLFRVTKVLFKYKGSAQDANNESIYK